MYDDEKPDTPIRDLYRDGFYKTSENNDSIPESLISEGVISPMSAAGPDNHSFLSSGAVDAHNEIKTQSRSTESSAPQITQITNSFQSSEVERRLSYQLPSPIHPQLTRISESSFKMLTSETDSSDLSPHE